MKKTMGIVVVCGLLGVGCGGGAPPAQEATNTTAEGEHHHGDMPPELAAFHDVLRPVWHSEPGATRATAACAAAADLDAKGDLVHDAAAPAGPDPAAWSAAVETMHTAVHALVTECATPEHAAAEARLTELHDAFHAVTDLLHH